MQPGSAIRELIEWAAATGADKQMVREAAAQLVGLVDLVFALKRQADPRKGRTAALARRVAEAEASLKRNGTTADRVPLLARQFGRSRSRIHALLAMSCESQEC
jgi:hypothetical protein